MPHDSDYRDDDPLALEVRIYVSLSILAALFIFAMLIYGVVA